MWIVISQNCARITTRWPIQKSIKVNFSFPSTSPQIRQYSSTNYRRRRTLPVFATVITAGVVWQMWRDWNLSTDEEETSLINWSGTHSCSIPSSRYFTPTTVKEVEDIVKKHDEQRQGLRPIGSALSPNGLGFSSDSMINLSLMDKIISVDKSTGLVKVEAGARIETFVEGLRPHGLSLPNYASIREQQVGGFIQVGAHGSGVDIPPVDEFVEALTLVTPRGTLHLSRNDTDPDRKKLFHYAKCGLGTFGVVVDVTFKCVPSHRLREETFVTTHQGVSKWHEEWLKEWRHLRYMWIPNTDRVVVVRSNPTDLPVTRASNNLESLKPLISLGKELEQEYPQKLPDFTTYTQLRDWLYLLDPISPQHVTRVNQILAKSFEIALNGITLEKNPSNSSVRIDWSDQILGFDCGGQQWVCEVAFPTIQGKDVSVDYMMELLDKIEKRAIPAHEPLEQRWTASSQSPLSPAHGQGPFTWVGIISYLPDLQDSEDVKWQRKVIASQFINYKETLKPLWQKYSCQPHWAKVELNQDAPLRCDFEEWKRLTLQVDPHGIFLNDFLRKLIKR